MAAIADVYNKCRRIGHGVDFPFRSTLLRLYWTTPRPGRRSLALRWKWKRFQVL